jgi:exopolysaccharide biosynthesis polyprenyl glycosylphosphotransferase
MIKEHGSAFKALRLAFDLGLVTGGYYLVYGLTQVYNPIGMVLTHPDYRLRLPVILALCWGISFLWLSAYDRTREVRRGHTVLLALKLLASTLVLFSLGLFLFKIQFLSRKFILVYGLLCTGLLMASKATEFWLLRLMRRVGWNHRSMVLVGEGKELEQATTLLREHAEWGYRLAGVVGLSKKSRRGSSVRWLGSLADLQEILRTRIVDEVVFAAPPGRTEAQAKVMALAAESGVSLRVMMDESLRGWHSEVDRLGELPVLSLSLRRPNLVLQAAKMVFDWASALLLVVVLSPLLAFVSLAILVTMGRPVFFRQKRAGYNGRVFFLYKFRTMVPEARQLHQSLASLNQMDGPVFKIKNDPRVTPLGRILRQTSLDELPQLLNVLKGELSLVGPRPLAKYEARKVPSWAWRRYSVKPGITCFWQVMGRNKIGFEDWMKLDLKYVDEWSFWTDLKILTRTLPAVLTFKGAH